MKPLQAAPAASPPNLASRGRHAGISRGRLRRSYGRGHDYFAINTNGFRPDARLDTAGRHGNARSDAPRGRRAGFQRATPRAHALIRAFLSFDELHAAFRPYGTIGRGRERAGGARGGKALKLWGSRIHELDLFGPPLSRSRAFCSSDALGARFQFSYPDSAARQSNVSNRSSVRRPREEDLSVVEKVRTPGAGTYRPRLENGRRDRRREAGCRWKWSLFKAALSGDRRQRAAFWGSMQPSRRLGNKGWFDFTGGSLDTAGVAWVDKSIWRTAIWLRSGPGLRRAGGLLRVRLRGRSEAMMDRRKRGRPLTGGQFAGFIGSCVDIAPARGRVRAQAL